MKLMEEKIMAEGQVLPGHILKVGSFLNQQIDINFMSLMAEEIVRRFAGKKITKVMTIESSGISFATLIAMKLGVKEVVVKKSSAANQSGKLYSAEIYSYTHGCSYTATVSCDYLSAGDSVLLVDDFLAKGQALHGLCKILQDAGATLAGCAIAVEKGFQGGGDALRAQGIQVESLAIIESMSDDEVVFRA